MNHHVFASIVTVVLTTQSLTVLSQTTSCVARPLLCTKITLAPVLDGRLTEWTNNSNTTLTADMYQALTRTKYDDGVATIRCRYDATNIYLAMEFPGLYSFNATNNHQCAAVSTMLKVGANAAYFNMGGCPDAVAGCTGGVPESCRAYTVDLGGHWELRTTQMGTRYDLNVSSSASVKGSGNDLLANKDDEYGVSPFCKFDDDDANAGNEWAGAWMHSNPIAGQPGTYVFEMSRTLRTASNVSDLQLAAGGSYKFGIAFWDPYELLTGWTDAGHYVTGCGIDWIDLNLVADTTTPITCDTSSMLCRFWQVVLRLVSFLPRV